MLTRVSRVCEEGKEKVGGKKKEVRYLCICFLLYEPFLPQFNLLTFLLKLLPARLIELQLTWYG